MGELVEGGEQELPKVAEPRVRRVQEVVED